MAKGYLEGSLWLGLEDNPSRMGRLGWWELAEGRVPPPEEYLAQLEALTAPTWPAWRPGCSAAPGSLAAVGPFDRGQAAGLTTRVGRFGVASGHGRATGGGGGGGGPDGRDRLRGGGGRPRPRAGGGGRRLAGRAGPRRASPSAASSRSCATPAPRSWSTSPWRRPPGRTCPVLAGWGLHAVVGTTGLGADDLDRLRDRLHPLELPGGAELRHRRGADDALRRAGGPVLRLGRDHRAAPRPEGRRPLGHGPRHRRADGRGLRQLDARPHPPGDLHRCPRWSWARAASTSTPCGCTGSGRPPGGAAGHHGPAAHPAPRQLRPDLVHARGAAGRSSGSPTTPA